MPDQVLAELLEHYGLIGLLFVTACAMTSAAWAQIRFLKRWQPQTARILEALELVADRMERQHQICTRHYEYAQRQIEGMGQIGNELKVVVQTIHESDRERNREIMHIVTMLAGRNIKVTD